jgi:hypothetical protein
LVFERPLAQRFDRLKDWPATSARHRRDLARRTLWRWHAGCGRQHLETYLRWVFGFIGVKNPEFISAGGIQVGPEHRQKAVASALKAASDLDAA